MKIILNEDLNISSLKEGVWTMIDMKSVEDSDGFYTDYTWYTDGTKHIFIFGDSDLYTPDNTEPDYEVEIYPGQEVEADLEAQNWFDSYIGFADEPLTEAYSQSVPEWLKKGLQNNNWLKTQLVKLGIDLANANIDVQTVPKSSFDKVIKNTDDYIVIYHIVDKYGKDAIHVPGITDEFEVALAGRPLERLKYISKKNILANTEDLVTVDLTQVNNSAKELQQKRAAEHQTDIKRYPQYAKNTSRHVYGRSLGNRVSWETSRGFDKSGYAITGIKKYVHMLDQADLSTYGRQLTRYENKINTIRDAANSLFSKLSVKTDYKIFNKFNKEVLSKFDDVLYYYNQLLENVQSILDMNQWDDEVKNEQIQQLFTTSYTIENLRIFLTKVKNALDEVQKEYDEHVKELERKAKEEQAQQEQQAQIDSTDNTTSNTETTSTPDEEQTQSVTESLSEIAEELKIDLNEDISTLRKDYGSDISDLELLKQYKADLDECGLLTKLTEGAISDLLIDVETEGLEEFIKILQAECIPLKKELHYLQTQAQREVGAGGAFDSQEELDAAIAEVTSQLDTVNAKLSILLDY